MATLDHLPVLENMEYGYHNGYALNSDLLNVNLLFNYAHWIDSDPSLLIGQNFQPHNRRQ